MTAAWRGFVRAWNRIPLREPWRLLVPLMVVHWIALAIFTTRVNHNGWLFYQGGDQIWFWTTGWLLGHGSITVPAVSQGWSMLLVPFSWIGGPGFVGGLPGTMLLQALVVAPVALWCVYELGARIGGRVIGYWAAAIWTLGPYVAVPLFVDRYHDRYVDQFLPMPLGLTAMADYTGTVFLLLSAVFTLRAIENRDPGTIAVAGLAAGFAALVKPSNLIYLAAPLLALVVARRWRELAIGAAALVPAAIALAAWKYRGYGYLPAFTYGEASVVALGPDSLTAPYDKYVSIDWGNIGDNLASLREVFWSMRVLQWLPFAGAIAVARKSIPAALLLSVWFWGFFILKGSAEDATIDSGAFFRFLLPAAPAFLLLAACLPLLVPKYGADLARRTALPKARAIGRRGLVTAVVVLGLFPVVAAAASSPLRGPDDVLQHVEIALPVEDIELEASGQRVVRLRWSEPDTGSTRVFYKLYRSPAETDYLCFEGGSGADRCTLVSVQLRTLRKTSALDRPGPGAWTYRVGAAANWVDDPELGDVFLLSNPVTVTVP